jgi:phosphatidate cytidylyltransferase
LIKRELDVKDSGFLFPGMGGVWDVTDSIIGAATPAYLVLLFVQEFGRLA